MPSDKDRTAFIQPRSNRPESACHWSSGHRRAIQRTHVTVISVDFGVNGLFPLVKSGLELKCAVEQRLARQAHNLEVVGSIPTGATFDHSTACDRKPPSRGGFFMRRLNSAAILLGLSELTVDPARVSDRCDAKGPRAKLWPKVARASPERPLPNRRTRRAWPNRTRMMPKR